MLVLALDDDNHVIHVDDSERSKDYHCPDCSGTVRCRKGEINAHHFYHLNNDCQSNGDYFYRGETSKDIYFSRMYIDTVRELYVNTSTRKHSTLSYVFQLMPFVHWKTNILVKDRMSNIENMEHLNMYDICELLGLETSKTSINNMKKELLSFRVVRDDKELYLFNYLKVGGAKGSKESFVINPLVYNAMSDFNDFKQVMVNMWVD